MARKKLPFGCDNHDGGIAAELARTRERLRAAEAALSVARERPADPPGPEPECTLVNTRLTR